MTKLDSQILDLQSAAKNLKEAISISPATSITKDASIKRFELAFEMAWKAIQSYIKDQGQDAPASPKECLRLAAKLDLILDPAPWFNFLKIRNYTSHIYSEAMASSFYEQIKSFLPLAQDLLLKLKSAAP